MTEPPLSEFVGDDALCRPACRRHRHRFRLRWSQFRYIQPVSNIQTEWMSSKAQQSEATRRKLLRVGRDLFARRGFADVPTEEIVRRAGVTRGALYHHFRDKRDLFAAVVEQVEQDVMERVAAAALAES